MPPPALPEVPASHVVIHEAPAKAPHGGTPLAEARPARTIPSSHPDDAYASDEPVPVRRLVYRVTLHIPPGLGAPSQAMPRTAAELYIDVSADRLRARFDGPVWPVPSGSEVRMRERPGAYVFDARGGRPLLPGGLAEWFYGGPVNAKHLPPAGIQPAQARERSGPGALVCAFVAEWAGQPREVFEHRCDEGGVPAGFRIGPWHAERTADVASELPKRDLRADDEGPPREAPHTDAALIAPANIIAALKSAGPRVAPDPAAPVPALSVHNRGDAAALITVRGVPLRWVLAGDRTVISGLPRGSHPVAAMRAFGNPVQPPRLITLPGELGLR